MREGGIFSGIFHLGLLVLVVVGLPSFRVPPPDPEPVSTVEVVTMAPKATAPDLVKPQPPKLPDPPKPVEVKPPPPPSPPPAATPTPAPPPLPVPAPKVEAPAPPKTVEKPKEPPKPKADPFETILKNLDKTRPPPTKTKEPPKPQQQQAVVPPPVQGAATLSPQLARSEMDAIRDHIRPCWNFPAGAKNAEELFVLIDVQMNPDATVREARISGSSQLSDPYYRSAAESALRAVLNCGQRPLPLSPEKYNTWKSMTLRFDPRDL